MSERTITHIPAKPRNVPVVDHPFRVAAYCRVSSPSEEQELSLETQVTYYSNKINSNPLWVNAGVFADTATGRNTKERTAFKKLLAQCRTGKVDLILTKAISRFGRNSLDTIKTLRELRGRGVDVYFEQENIHLLDPTAQHTIEVYCALAQNESENKSHNIKWGIKAGFEQGTSGYQHFACYGYRFDEPKQTLVIVPNEAEVVRMIFDLRLQGFSYGKISAELAKQNIPSPAGKPIWSREGIRKILCNEKYAGSVILQKTYVEDFFTGKQKKNAGQLQRYLYKNNHEPIVAREIFEEILGGKIMKCLGVAIKKGEIWYAIVDGLNMEEAIVVETGKQVFRAESSAQVLMMDFHNIFTELITKFIPDRVAYRLHLDSTMQQIPYMHFSLGVLNLICQQKGITSTERSNKWITAGKRSKITNFENHFSNRNFKNDELAAALLAWHELN